jgi:hypothetical protein
MISAAESELIEAEFATRRMVKSRLGAPATLA